MNEKAVRRVVFFILLLLLQAFVFQYMVFGWEGTVYAQIFIYPLFIIELPVKMRTASVILWGFALGLAVDIFYMSPGIHAGATTFLAYGRKYVLNLLEPRAGYNVEDIPSKHHLGIGWITSFVLIMLGLHHFAYFCLELFSIQFFFEIWIKSVFSVVFSGLVILLYQFLFDPKAGS